MNIILLEAGEPDGFFSRTDPRAVHLIEVLRITVGTPFFVGRINGPRGKALPTAIDAEGIRFTVEWEDRIDGLPPIHLLVGLPRPQTARRILQDVTSIGVSTIHFFRSARGEPGYAQSTLWSGDEWRRLLLRGAEQAFSTCLPTVHHHDSLAAAIAAQHSDSTRLALDVYEANAPLTARQPLSCPVSIAIGSERGWEASERDTLRNSGFLLLHLGPRVLRTETACIAALSRILDSLNQ